MTTTLIEGMIPKHYLLRLAVYLQTCAHIKRETWSIVQLIEGYDRADEVQTV